jgi:transcriptional regulator with XRE-family HTH domain
MIRNRRRQSTPRDVDFTRQTDTAAKEGTLPEARSVVFARQVRRQREQRGWSQEELARRLAGAGHPIGQSRVSAIEAPGPDPRTVALDQAQAFADAFGVPLEQLLGANGQITRGVVLRELVYVLELADVAVLQTVEHANALREMAARLVAEQGVDPGEYLTEQFLQPVQIRRGGE